MKFGTKRLIFTVAALTVAWLTAVAFATGVTSGTKQAPPAPHAFVHPPTESPTQAVAPGSAEQIIVAITERITSLTT